MTVGDIAEAAGITRGALYFYFASKQDVLTALVARTVQALQEKSGAALADTAPVEDVIATALERTAQLWREHGPVMRAAVDLGSTVPEIDRLWTEHRRRLHRGHHRGPASVAACRPGTDRAMPRHWGGRCAG